MWLDNKPGESSTTANRISGLRSFFRYLVRMEYRADDPTLNIKAPKRSKGIPKPPEDFEAVLELLDAEDAAANRKMPSLNRRVGETRDIATFLAETGLRISEGCSVAFDGPAPEVFNVIGKGNKEAPVLMTPKAREAIDRLGGRIGIGPRAVQRRFERAGIHPHMLRHWRATSLVRSGVEIGTVSKIMRHSSPAITMVYAQYDEALLRAALEQAST